ncbi:AzlD domain-containing protein [Ureibacillus sinduriensis]|uniref:Branched-chain amino acid transporter AzlD n=1 Tax=Ureibacillus sinduriensis BLB-1 = JCM 15800 TaxID=1384057 RepID=A0A0A3HYU8_9BACL|nr:AzlD domain-containing protein [Ureibacillus sinduriensis]KGR76430.1 branched-chain amino acid transporter AzlD [Ureibacillus sinduriensis BLB-1 = JCM 15800]
MSISLEMLLLMLGCALVTWIPRVTPFILVRNLQLPDVVLRWLAYIPVCILSALVIESLYHAEGKFVTFDWLNLIAFIPTLIVAIWTKSLSKTVIVGVMTMAVLRFFL